ncbi:MAG: class II aldolase/adducin family protein [Gemmatimonadaceae bacterium]|nr:class II aldolase/adducin family protein [Gemmatimonadaceae bacterium]
MHPARPLLAPRALREAVVRVGQGLAARGLVAGQDGNISVRVDDERLLVTPAGFRKGELDVDDLCEVACTDGRWLAGAHAPSSELGLHLVWHAWRPDVTAVVHAHPPVATGFAAAGVPIADDVLPEVAVALGPVPVVPYAEPGTPALGAAVRPFVTTHDALLLANHGAVTVGATLRLAHDRMEHLEQAARILLTARLLGGAVTLDPSALRSLRARRERPADGDHDA